MNALDVLNVSRTEVAHKRHGAALEKVQGMAMEVRAAFEELYAAGEQLRQAGAEVTVTLDFPLSEAWMEWRAKRYITDQDARPGR